jgi:hypothetical protein
MAAQLNGLSASITNYDATNPTVMNTTGMGASGGGYLLEVSDWAAFTLAGTGTATSYLRIVRFPTTAKIKSVMVASNVALDASATYSLGFDFNVAFSDSTIDGTPPDKQAKIPLQANDGTMTTFATYAATPNKMFGANWQYDTDGGGTANTAIKPTNITFANIATYSFLQITMQPLWETFGFTRGDGNLQDPGGYFDLTAYVSVVAGTPAAGNLWMKVEYVR